MKYLLMCEGNNEVALMNLLLDNNKLTINRSDLIGLKPYNLRQLKHPTIRTELKHYNNIVTIYRIGDTLPEELKIPNDLKEIVLSQKIYKFCTKPELEILLIINENLWDDYNKSKMSPKDYAKGNIIYNGVRYNQASDYLVNYFGGKRINNLVDSLIKYKHLKKHNKKELYLSDLLKTSKKNKN